MTMQQEMLFAFGLGYSADVLAHALLAKGWQVGGTVRSEEKAARETGVFVSLEGG